MTNIEKNEIYRLVSLNTYKYINELIINLYKNNRIDDFKVTSKRIFKTR